MTGCSLKSLIPIHQTPENDDPVITPENSDKNSPPEEGPKDEMPVLPTYYNSLTGLASDTDVSMIRPVAICYGNDGSALQYGIGQAKILVEAPIENGETRLLMITDAYSSLPQIGSVSTARPYLLSMAHAFSAVSACAGTSDVHASASFPAYEVLDHSVDGFHTVFYRQSSLAAPNNLFTSGTRLVGALEIFEKKGGTTPYPLADPGQALAPTGGRASGALIPFSAEQVSQFVYDAERQLYLRKQNSQVHADPQTGEQLGFTNLLLLVCESSTYHKVTGTELDLNVESGGKGYYLSLGGYQEITWSRGENGNFIFTDAQKREIAINCGTTYIGLVDLVNSASLLIIE